MGLHRAEHNWSDLAVEAAILRSKNQEECLRDGVEERGKWFLPVYLLHAYLVCAQSLQLCPTVAHQTALSMGFSRQEYWRVSSTQTKIVFPCENTGVFCFVLFASIYISTRTYYFKILCSCLYFLIKSWLYTLFLGAYKCSLTNVYAYSLIHLDSI